MSTHAARLDPDWQRLSAEAVGVFKPDPRVYRFAAERFALEPRAIAFFSSNPWDAFGALACGFRVFWVNRSGQPNEYGLRGEVTELADLTGVPQAIE
jgi:2-haloacid dehalogenase